jgi:uncharacterized protein (TIGR03382 family)
MLKFIRLIVVVGVASLALAPATASAWPKKWSRPARAVPEINGKHAGGAVALVLGGVAVVLGRRRRKIA